MMSQGYSFVTPNPTNHTLYHAIVPQDSSNGQLAFPEAVAKAALTEGAFMYHYHHR